jgi:flagellar hook protein FlgE
MPIFSIPLSGLTASSEALSTIANNLANLNTTGYKDQRAQFQDLFYQSLGSTGAATGSGNPILQGAGVKIGAIGSLFTQGSVSSSGVNTDVAIQGEGFFVAKGSNGGVTYTRAGDFSIDKSGLLETADGGQVMGYVAVNGAISPGQALAPLNLGTGQLSPPTATTNVSTTMNLDATAAVGGTFSAPVTVFDSLGASHVLSFNFAKTGSGAWSYTVTIPAADVGAAGPGPVTLTSGALAFDGAGNLTGPAADIAGITASGFADGANPLTFTWQVYDKAGGPLVHQDAAPSSTSSTLQDGNSSGSLVTFNIGSDGTVSGSFSNGRSALVAQLALATFGNEQGLLRTGNNAFVPTLASGQAVVGTPGAGGRGTLSGGALELSNVDIATEFAALIVAQRTFQANAKAVTTFDQVTQDTINLKQ